MTDKILDWLNQNRFRAYPFVDDIGLVSNGSRIPDCVLLDCLVMDTRHGITSPELVFTEIDVTSDRTEVKFKYCDEPYAYTLAGSEESSGSSYSAGGATPDIGESSIVRVDGRSISGIDDELFFIKLVFSSHDYILGTVGEGHWEFNGRVLPSKVMSVAASGVACLRTAGSAYVQGFNSPGAAKGAVRLVDGFRTQPSIQNGKIVVKVGAHYGEDPCHYREDDPEYREQRRKRTACGELMFFFCGQNATDTGDVALEGGPGVTVKQGGTYTAKYDIIDTYGEIGVTAGEKIPCIEVVAAPSLLGIYRPADSAESPSGDDD